MNPQLFPQPSRHRYYGLGADNSDIDAAESWFGSAATAIQALLPYKTVASVASARASAAYNDVTGPTAPGFYLPGGSMPNGIVGWPVDGNGNSRWPAVLQQIQVVVGRDGIVDQLARVGTWATADVPGATLTAAESYPNPGISLQGFLPAFGSIRLMLEELRTSRSQIAALQGTISSSANSAAASLAAAMQAANQQISTLQAQATSLQAQVDSLTAQLKTANAAAAAAAAVCVKA
jgi:hypothetical protein